MLDYQATQQTYAELVSRFSILGKENTQLSKKLQEKAYKMEQQGQLLQEDDLRQMQEVFSQTQQLQTTLSKLGNLLFGEHKPWQQLISLNDLEYGLQAIAETLDHPEINVLIHARSIIVRPGRMASKLVEFYERIDSLLTVLQNTPPTEVRARIDQAHVLIEAINAMVTIVDQGENLEDDACESLRETAIKAFDKALVISALRGNLMFGQPQALSTPTYPPSTSEPASISNDPVCQPQVFFEEPTDYPTISEDTEDTKKNNASEKSVEELELQSFSKSNPREAHSASTSDMDAQQEPSSVPDPELTSIDTIPSESGGLRRRRRPIFMDWAGPSKEPETSTSNTSNEKGSDADIKKNDTSRINSSSWPTSDRQSEQVKPQAETVLSDLIDPSLKTSEEEASPSDALPTSSDINQTLQEPASTIQTALDSFEEAPSKVLESPLPAVHSMTEHQVKIANELVAIEKIFTAHANHEIIMAALMRHSIGHLNFVTLPPDQAENAAQTLQTWFSMETDRHAISGDIGHMLSIFGLHVQSTAAQDNSRARFIVRAQPIDSSSLLSYINPAWKEGIYHISCFWGNPPESMLWTELNQSMAAHQRTPIFFYFGVLSQTQRKALSKRCRAHNHELLVVDNALALHLCVTSENPIKALFGSILPYGSYSY